MHDRLSHWLAGQVASRLAARFPPTLGGLGLQLADGDVRHIGQGPREATIVVRDRSGLLALVSMDATRIAEAYRAGTIDVEGPLEPVLRLRETLADRHPFTDRWRFIRPRLFGQVRSDVKWIADHYDRDADFYLTFIDRRHRCYSHAVFASESESLEDATTRKLDGAIETLGLPPGSRILDIGGGWGTFTEHAGKRGYQVTSLTISPASARFIQSIIDRDALPCRVRLEHLMEHRVSEPYDGIVNIGVTEHLPDYPGTLRQYAALLKPGGRVYLDAAAGRKSHDLSAFLLKYIYPGNGTLLCLQDYVAAVAASPFELLHVVNDREHYRLTAWHWATNLDANRDEIVRRWGAETYRTFRLYLWGCADGFKHDVMQAYRWALHLPRR